MALKTLSRLLNLRQLPSLYGGKSEDCRLPLQDTAIASLQATVSGLTGDGVGFTVLYIRILVLAILASCQITSLLGE